MKFLRDITYRDGSGSSKKVWYNMSCLSATIIILWTGYKLPTEQGMDDWTYIWLFAIYLCTVGGFEVVLQILKLIVQWKNGQSAKENIDAGANQDVPNN